MTKHIDVNIPVLFFKERNKTIVYSPVLDISSFGDNDAHAEKRFAETVSIFLSELLKMGTLAEVLEECGWHKAPTKRTWIPPIYDHVRSEPVKIPIS